MVWTLFTRLLRGDWPWQVGALDESTPGKDTTQIVLTVIAGLGAAVALVVAYRRQRDAELARFDERFAAAAAQLGAPTAAERLAGVYAMAALADTWEQHRQQCIDVLCGYLRLPYDPTNALLTTVVSEHTWPIGAATGKETRTYEQLPNDREVRLTIISTITHHLRDPADGGAPISWQGHDLDFTGATFDGGDFSRRQLHRRPGHLRPGDVHRRQGHLRRGGVHRRLRSTSTRRRSPAARSPSTRRSSPAAWSPSTEAQFTGGEVTFAGASSPAARSTSTGAKFTGGQVTFAGASSPAARSPSTGPVHRRPGHLRRGGVHRRPGHLRRGAFTGGQVTFDGAEFTGGQVTFDGAEFTARPGHLRRGDIHRRCGDPGREGSSAVGRRPTRTRNPPEDDAG